MVAELNGISQNPAQTSPFDQYSLFLIPSLFVSVLVLMQNVAWRPSWRFRWRALIGVVFVLVMAVHLHDTTWGSAPGNTKELDDVLPRIPAGAPVVAQNFVMPHFANRNRLYDTNQLDSLALKKGTYVVLDPSFTTGNTPPQIVTRWLADLSRSQKVLYQADGVSLFEIVHATKGGAP
jgi:hypothetical protein